MRAEPDWTRDLHYSHVFPAGEVVEGRGLFLVSHGDWR